MLTTINKISSDVQTGFMNSFTFFGLNHTTSTWLVVAISIVAILFISYCFFHLINKYLLRSIKKIIIKQYPLVGKSFFSLRIFHRLSHLIPAIIIYFSADLLAIAPSIYSINLVHFFKSTALSYMMISISLSIAASLNIFERNYANLKISTGRSIKGFIQGIKIILFAVTSILVISQLLNKSPFYLFTSMGAIAAIVLMTFKEQLLGFIANIQIATTDLVRLGDIINIPQSKIEGTVVEISLSRIKIQNADNSISSIPANTLLSNGVKNWRDIQKRGGRNIKRLFNIDVSTIKFCDDLLIEDLKMNQLVTSDLYQNFLKANQIVSPSGFPTNLGIFRYYLAHYLNKHPKVNHDMPCMIRYLESTAHGIPVEIYLFTKEVNVSLHEKLQADFFDHIFAILPYFKLRIFQSYGQQEPESWKQREPSEKLTVAIS